jgi:hypothetical protein
MKLLKLRNGRIAEGHAPAPNVDKTTFSDLAAMLIDDYEPTVGGRCAACAAASRT